VGEFRLLHRLGTGGMGRVYLGESTAGAMVAVKLIRADLADDPDFRRRFAQEVAAAKRVSGPFTATVVDADPDGPQPWLVTAYVSGPSLADAVTDHGPLPVASVRALAAGLARGLSTVHAAGLVHGDLKPSNVLLGLDGPRIIDFGIARAADSTWLTCNDGVMGSPGFMSPEQAEGLEVGPAADIFSLGGVLAYAASGKPPFGSGSPSALLYRVVYSSASLGHVPADLRPLIEQCLAKNPAGRPGIADLLAALGTAEPGAPIACGNGRAANRSRAASRSRVARGAARLHRAPVHDTIADQTRPARYSRYGRYLRRRKALAGWGLALLLVTAGTVGAGLATHQHRPAGPPSVSALPMPRLDQRKQTETMPTPQDVVRAYIAAINARDWRQVWQLGGRRLSPSYHAMVAGYAGTVRDEIQSLRVRGDLVTVELLAYQAGQAERTYRVDYRVRDGVITSAGLLASSVTPAPGAVAVPPRRVCPLPQSCHELPEMRSNTST
jgi:hypothetical protein